MDVGLKDYEDQQKSIKNFFPRFPEKPNFKGKTILEFDQFHFDQEHLQYDNDQ